MGIIDHFGSINPYKKEDAQQKKFMKDLLFVAKDYMPISIVGRQWLKHSIMCQIPKLCFQIKSK
jgi:hypothetical protein